MSMKKKLLFWALSFLSFHSIAGDRMLAFHLDFNTLQFKREAIVEILEKISAAGYNAVLWEIEDKVRWETCPEVSSPGAFSKEEFRKILAKAKELGLEPIPLMQTFGHAEYVLSREMYKPLRERPDRKNCYCPSNPRCRTFLKQLLHEYLDLFGSDVRRFHLGGDEAYGYGSCEKCKGRDAVGLYVEHLEAVAAELRERRIRPAVWHDMLKHFDKTCRSFARLPGDFTICYWEYFTDYESRSEEILASLRREASAGREIVVCPSIQCYCDDPFLVRYGMHRANVADMADVCRENRFAGLCVTSWSVHSGLKKLQFPLIDFAAMEFRSPNREVNWRTAFRSHFGDLPLSALDDLTEWTPDIRLIDGRYSDYKDSALPRADKIEETVKDEQSRKTHADKICNVLKSVERGLGEIRNAKSILTPMARLAVEAGELKLSYHRAQLDRLFRKPVDDLPIKRMREFYECEQPPATAWHSVRRVCIPIVEELSRRESPEM